MTARNLSFLGGHSTAQGGPHLDKENGTSVGEQPIGTSAGPWCTSPEAATLDRRTTVRQARQEVFARLFTLAVRGLSASAAVFLPGVSTQVARPSDFTNGPPARR